MLSLSYPHERVAWAALPTKNNLMIEVIKFSIIMVYSENTLATYTIPYMNFAFVLGWGLILR